MRKFNKFLTVALSVAMVATMAGGCGKSNSTSSNGGGKSADGKVTIKLFSNLTDRKNGQGRVEQTIIDEYEKENPNVKIEVEAIANGKDLIIVTLNIGFFINSIISFLIVAFAIFIIINF